MILLDNFKYIAYSYIIITNLTLNHEDSCIILNRELTVSPNGLGITTSSKGDSRLDDSIDSKFTVKRLTSSQKYKPISMFVTYKCNQSKHFGVCGIKNWVGLKEWTKYYPDFKHLFQSKQRKNDTSSCSSTIA